MSNSWRCIFSGRGRCTFDPGCFPVTHGELMLNHVETRCHLPCDCIIIDVCRNCHPDLPGHVIRRISGYIKRMFRSIDDYLRASQRFYHLSILGLIGFHSNAHNILNVCFNCPRYAPCRKDKEIYDKLFWIAYNGGMLIAECLTDVGRAHLNALKKKYGDRDLKDVIRDFVSEINF